jgi:hypothetical protein
MKVVVLVLPDKDPAGFGKVQSYTTCFETDQEDRRFGIGREANSNQSVSIPI